MRGRSSCGWCSGAGVGVQFFLFFRHATRNSFHSRKIDFVLRVVPWSQGKRGPTDERGSALRAPSKGKDAEVALV